MPNKVTFLALKLFGVNVEADGQHRYVMGGNNVKSIPDPSLRLSGGATDVVAVELLGGELIQCINKTTRRKDENKLGISVTECLSMRVSCKPDTCAHLYIRLDISELYSMHNRLFPENSN
jgi:hypothetical protein